MVTVKEASKSAVPETLFKAHLEKGVEEPASVVVAAVWQCFVDRSERRPGDEAQQDVERRLGVARLSGQHAVHHELAVAGDDAGALAHRSPRKDACLAV